MNKVLITYYTRTNTTKEICEYIGNRLEENNKIIIKPIQDVDDISDFDKIIIGAPIHGMNWANEAKEFIEKNTDELKNKVIGLFFDAYLINNSYGFWNSIIKKSLKKQEMILNPVAIGKFSGRVDKPFTAIPKLIFGCSKEAPLDRRDTNEVDEFINKFIN